jgi:hypothetical protein
MTSPRKAGDDGWSPWSAEAPGGDDDGVESLAVDGPPGAHVHDRVSNRMWSTTPNACA